MSQKMSDKRIIHEVSDDDLVALALGEVKQDQVIQKVSKAAKFILHNRVKHGDTKIPAMLLYFTYINWQDGLADHKRKFLEDFSNYFPKHVDAEGPYFLLNSDPFDLSKEAYWNMRAYWRRKKSRNVK